MVHIIARNTISKIALSVLLGILRKKDMDATEGDFH